MTPELKMAMPHIIRIVTKAEKEILNETGVRMALQAVHQPTDEEQIEQMKKLFLLLCKRWDVHYLTITAKSRKTELVMMRKLCCMAARKKFGKNIPYKVIGELLGMGNHSSVMKAIDAGYDLLATRFPPMVNYYDKVKDFFDETNTNK